MAESTSRNFGARTHSPAMGRSITPRPVSLANRPSNEVAAKRRGWVRRRSRDTPSHLGLVSQNVKTYIYAISRVTIVWPLLCIYRVAYALFLSRTWAPSPLSARRVDQTGMNQAELEPMVHHSHIEAKHLWTVRLAVPRHSRNRQMRVTPMPCKSCAVHIA